MTNNLRTRAAQLRALDRIKEGDAHFSTYPIVGTANIRVYGEYNPFPIAEFDLRRALTPAKKRKAK